MAVPEVTRHTTSLSGPLKHQALPAGHEQRSAPPARRRAWAALAWAAGAAALFVLFLRITLADTRSMTSDPANNALQAWDMLHGHLLLHGWIVGDATFYTFELPLIAIAEIFFGLHIVAVQVTVALVYVGVAACAVAIAVTDSRGASRAVRAGVTVAVLAAPALIASDTWIPLGFPDHTGTSLIVLVSFLLVDRAVARRYTAPLLCAILCAGQISDVTVRYVAVPAIVLVCGYRALAARKIATGDAASLAAAAVSVPLALAVRALMRNMGAYLMVTPKTQIAPISRWPHNAALTWYALRMLFGIQAAPGVRPAGTAAIFGFGCLLVAVAGMVRVLWRWRTVRRAEQLLLVAIIVNLGAYTISTLPSGWVPHDIVAVLPAGAILGARTVPARIAGRATALAATSVAAVAALLPLSLAATRPAATPSVTQLTRWLQAHGLRYGLGGYWDSSAVTLQSDGQVDVRTVQVDGREITPWAWETYTGWYDPARHYANFVVIDLAIWTDLGPQAERFFGKPVSAHRVVDWEILIYHRNVLDQVKPPTIEHVS